MFPEHCSVTQSASGERMDVVCDMPQRPSRGLVWSSSADWLPRWSCGWRTPMSCSSERDLVGGPGKCMRHRVGMRERGESMHGFCETPDTVVIVDETFFFFIFWISVPRASGEQASDNWASIFHIGFSFLSVLVISVRECGVSCTVKCSSKEQAHLIKNVSWCCNADCLKTLTGCQLCCWARPGSYTSPHYGCRGPHTAAAQTHTLRTAELEWWLLQFANIHL